MDRVLLRFTEEQIPQPITAHVILDLGVPLNILNANITPFGGEVLIGVPAAEVNRVVQAFKERGVDATVQKHILVDEEKCTHCGACYSLCPVDAVAFEEDKTVVFDGDKCVLCGLCVDACPTRAISL